MGHGRQDMPYPVTSTLPQLPKQAILNLGKLHWFRAFRVVVRHMVDPGAHGIAPHTGRLCQIG